MLPPPPRSTAAVLLDSSNTSRELGRESDIVTPEGVYKALDDIFVPLPMAHPSDPLQNVINPLAADTHQPESQTLGVRFLPLQLQEAASKAASSKRRPATNLSRGNKSSVVSRATVFEGYSKRVLEQQSNLLAWLNVGRSINLLDLDLEAPSRVDPLAKILMSKAWPQCMAVNLHTLSSSQIDIALGLTSGEVVWIEMNSNRFSRINRQGSIVSASPVTSIEWLPETESFVVVGYADGLVAIYDVDREDGMPINVASANENPSSTPVFKVVQSGTSQTRNNPVAVYKVSNASATDIKFGAGVMAVSSADGFIRLVDLDKQQVTDILPSYFGGITCLEFSPDGQYLVLGGECDGLSVYQTSTWTLQARFKGHTGFVTSVAFDPFGPELSAGVYRIASVAQDGNLFLWDFVPQSLAKPRNAAALEPSSFHKTLLHPFIRKNNVPIVLPTSQMSPIADINEAVPLTDVAFTEKCILVSSSDGHVYTWVRPTEV